MPVLDILNMMPKLFFLINSLYHNQKSKVVSKGSLSLGTTTFNLRLV